MCEKCFPCSIHRDKIVLSHIIIHVQKYRSIEHAKKILFFIFYISKCTNIVAIYMFHISSENSTQLIEIYIYLLICELKRKSSLFSSLSSYMSDDIKTNLSCVKYRKKTWFFVSDVYNMVIVINKEYYSFNLKIKYILKHRIAFIVEIK